MLYVIGLGLSDERDITVKGLDAVKSCERIYLEAYTSILMVEKEKLVRYEDFFSIWTPYHCGKQVATKKRTMYSYNYAHFNL